jgi:translation initiation factor IF-3
MKQINKFTDKGYKVKLIIVFKGREHSHRELGVELLENAKDYLSEKNECIISNNENLLMQIEGSSKQSH